VLFIDDEQVNRDAIMALGWGNTICKPDLNDYTELVQDPHAHDHSQALIRASTYD
jgi:hypothetical protein